MSVFVHDDEAGDAQHPFAGAVHKLSYHGAAWAEASLDLDASTVAIGCAEGGCPIIQVRLGTTHPLGCSIKASAVKSWPTPRHEILDRPIRGAEQLLDLIDACRQPWAEIQIGDRVHFFDPSGRERARVIRTWNGIGSRLALRCWDEAGKEALASEFATA